MTGEIKRIDKIRLAARMAALAGWGPEKNPHPEGTDAYLIWQVAFARAKEERA